MKRKQAQSVLYAIDGDDRIDWVSDSWSLSAAQDGAPHLATGAVLGSSLWEHISDESTRALYQMLIESVRQTGEDVEVSLRCDSPVCRRWLTLQISAMGAGRVLFTSRLLREEPHPPVALLDPTRDRSDEFVTICSWCNRVEVEGGAFVQVDAAVAHLNLFDAEHLPQLTHGMCPGCLSEWQHKIALLADEKSTVGAVRRR